MSELMRLNVGCGRDIRKGWVNIDKYGLPGVDVIHDLQVLPLPFKDEHCDEILCQDVLEHFDDYIPLMRELCRILRPGGALTVRVPHFSTAYNFVDPTHKRSFSFRTFDYFVKSETSLRNYYFDFGFTRVEEVKIIFPKNLYLHNYLIEPVINLHQAMLKLYEGTFLSRLLPAENVIVRLIK